MLPGLDGNYRMILGNNKIYSKENMPIIHIFSQKDFYEKEVVGDLYSILKKQIKAMWDMNYCVSLIIILLIQK